MKKIKYNLLIALSGIAFLSSCNKELEQLDPIQVPGYPTGTGIAATIAANPNDSLFNKLIARAGYAATLNDLTKTYTLFAVDNAGMRIFVNAASGGAIPINAPDATHAGFISGSLPAASAAGIMQYLTLGLKLPSASIGTGFPNFPYTNQIVLDPTQPFVRMPIFPVRGTPYSYVNGIPITGVDQTAANGVIHHTFTIVSPLPTTTLRSLMYDKEPTLSLFKELVLRADIGQVVKPNNDSTNFLNYLLGYAVTNMTVLAPSDTAVKTLITALTAGAVPIGSPNAVFAGFIQNSLPVINARGIVAYHILGSKNTGSWKPDVRAFSNNFPTTAIAAKTLFNSVLDTHPGISAQAFYTGPVADSIKFTGVGNGGAAAKTSTGKMDKVALNGVFHIIDRVLLPQ